MKIFNTSNEKYTFTMQMQVRDYELDCEAIVNNANYLHYMEHTRHQFCKQAGLSFIEMHNQGIDVVVRKIEIEYKSSLRSGDTFTSCLRMEKKGVRFIFYQDIIRDDGLLCVSAVVTVVALEDGKISRGEELVKVFGKYL